MRQSLLLAAILLLQGCATTPLVWTKPDADQATVAADLRQCHQLASDESWRMSWANRWPPAFYNPRFMPPYYDGRRPFWLDYPPSLEREQALVEFCMHSKGYHMDSLPY